MPGECEYWEAKYHRSQEKLRFIEEELKDHCTCQSDDVKHNRLQDLCLFCRVLFKLQAES